jgi:Asp-tRNA(Asn)/Glu-tRNA(Gln) amidotransferase A subunit family amidase
MGNNLVLEPAVRQLELLRTRAISVTELAEAHIRQIERLNPTLNALIDFDAERVLTRARKHDEWKGTRARRPLFGLPVTVKSSIATRGLKCEIGSLLHKGEVPAHDAVAVARLRAAGALIVGTTNCPEFLMAYETDNLLHGRTRNPWDLERSPGGSSGGQRRIRPHPSALHRHLFAQAHARTHSGTRSSAALRGAISDSRRHRPDGSDDRRCDNAVQSAEWPRLN